MNTCTFMFEVCVNFELMWTVTDFIMSCNVLVAYSYVSFVFFLSFFKFLPSRQLWPVIACPSIELKSIPQHTGTGFFNSVDP
jgi:hypothetical protein